MEYLITFIVFVLIFSFLILIHELGHFWAAKKAGIKVEEFGLGLPPRVWGKKKGETIYSINWIPFGGFVRMYGEDATDSKYLRSNRSFIGKPMRDRVKVVVAGVVMNFLVAWILLGVGFTVGMQPLLGPDDVFDAVSEGQVLVETGVVVAGVEQDSLAMSLGFEVGDRLHAVDEQRLDGHLWTKIKEEPEGRYEFFRGDSRGFIDVEGVESFDELGLQLFEPVSFPRVKIFDVIEGTDAYDFGLRPGDVIISVNDQQVFNVEQFESLIRGVPTLEYEVYRDGLLESVIVESDHARQVVVADVLPGSPADVIGLMEGDIIRSINGKEIRDSQELIDFVVENKGNVLAYSVVRDGETIFYEIQPGDDGRIGVLLSELISYGEQDNVSVYNADVLSSVTEIKEEKYPIHQAFYKSLGETYRMSKMTAKMFVGFISSLLKSGEVPDSVAGPVGIAQMTHSFIQEGVVPVLRFVALLSLSLAVINILPFPALDGGRLLFIIVELIIGRRVNQKWESYIHALGYLLILLLIVTVTYSDIVRLLS